MNLSVEHVCKEYPSASGTLRVLEDVSFTLAPGDTLAVTGASGSGKSTLLNLIGSLDTPTSGAVRLGDVSVPDLAGPQLARFRSRHVGFVFQRGHLLPQCTALENVLVPTLAAPAPDAADRATALLDRVGLSERLHAFPARLSGGECQRVAIARALINEPNLLLCDEPTGNLDHDTGERIGTLFAELARERSVMLVIVTHDIEFARRFARCTELRDGVLHERDLERGN